MSRRALIVGQKSVGTAISALCRSKGWPHSFLGSHVISEYLRIIRKFDVGFIAISNEDEGQAELQYLLGAIQAEIPVVTCAKAALAYHFIKLAPYRDKFSALASVGCQSRQLEIFGGKADDPFESAYAIQNGSVNYACWSKQLGKDDPETYAEMCRRKLLEGGSTDLISAVRKEFRDSLLKGTTSVNWAGCMAPRTPHHFTQSCMTDAEILRYISTPGVRLVTEISRRSLGSTDGCVFWHESPPWCISASFRSDAPQIFKGMNIDEEMNAARVTRKKSGVLERNGLGAGADKAAEVMFDEAQRLLGLK